MSKCQTEDFPGGNSLKVQNRTTSLKHIKTRFQGSVFIQGLKPASVNLQWETRSCRTRGFRTSSSWQTKWWKLTSAGLTRSVYRTLAPRNKAQLMNVLLCEIIFLLKVSEAETWLNKLNNQRLRDVGFSLDRRLQIYLQLLFIHRHKHFTLKLQLTRTKSVSANTLRNDQVSYETWIQTLRSDSFTGSIYTLTSRFHHSDL